MSQDQPSKVSTSDSPSETDAPRPPDTAVVTDELEASGQAKAAPAKGDKKSAAASNDSKSATGNPEDRDEGQPSKQPRDRQSERRMTKLSRQLAAEKDRNTANETRMKSLETELETLKAAVPKPPEPKRADFQSDVEYAKAWSKWEEGPAPKAPAKSAAETADSKSKKADAAKPELSPQIKEFHAKGAKKLGDEFTVALEDDDVDISVVMGDFLIDSDFGPELYVYFSDHHDVARTLFDQTNSRHKAFDMPKAIERLEALEARAKNGKLITGAPGSGDGGDDAGKGAKGGDKGKEAKGKEQPGDTKAPKPAEGGPDRGNTVLDKDPEDESMDEYAARRQKEIEALDPR